MEKDSNDQSLSLSDKGKDIEDVMELCHVIACIIAIIHVIQNRRQIITLFVLI